MSKPAVCLPIRQGGAAEHERWWEDFLVGGRLDRIIALVQLSRPIGLGRTMKAVINGVGPC